MRDALVVDVVGREAIEEAIEKAATDAVMRVRVRRVVLLESLPRLSVVDLAEAVAILRLLLRCGETVQLVMVEYENPLSSIAEWQH